MQTTGDTGHQCQWLQRPYTCRELCESRGGRPGLPIVDVKQHWTEPGFWCATVTCRKLVPLSEGPWEELRNFWAEVDGVCPFESVLEESRPRLWGSGSWVSFLQVLLFVDNPLLTMVLCSMSDKPASVLSEFSALLSARSSVPAQPWRPLVTTLVTRAWSLSRSTQLQVFVTCLPLFGSAGTVVHWACSKYWMSFWTDIWIPGTGRTTAASGRWLGRVVAAAAAYCPAAAVSWMTDSTGGSSDGSFSSVGSGPLAWSAELQACRRQCRLLDCGRLMSESVFWADTSGCVTLLSHHLPPGREVPARISRVSRSGSRRRERQRQCSAQVNACVGFPAGR